MEVSLADKKVFEEEKFNIKDRGTLNKNKCNGSRYVSFILSTQIIIPLHTILQKTSQIYEFAYVLR